MYNVNNILYKINKIGALTSKNYSFTGRAWELEKIETLDYLNSLGSSLFIEIFNLKIIRILPRLTKFKYSEWINDQIRYNYDTLSYQRLLNCLQGILINKFFRNYKYNLISWNFSFSYFKFLQKFNKYYSKDKFKIFLNFKIFFILNEDCDSFFFKTLINLGSYILIYNVNFIKFSIENLSNYILMNNDLEFKNIYILYIIGLNLRFENPLLMSIIFLNWKFYGFKIYSIYTTQTSLFFYKNFSFSIIELIEFLLFKNKFFCNIYYSLKTKNFNNLLFFLLNSRLFKILKLENFYLFFKNYFIILKKYFNIKMKILIENLYLYNYLFNINYLLQNNFEFKILLKKTNDFYYYNSYFIIYWFFNLGIFYSKVLNKFSFPDLKIYTGHHGNFIQYFYFDLIFPNIFIYEQDSLYYNLFGLLLSSKFVYISYINIYENIDIIKFFCFYLNNNLVKIYFKNLKSIIYIKYLNYKLFLYFFLTYNYLYKFFKYEISSFLIYFLDSVFILKKKIYLVILNSNNLNIFSYLKFSSLSNSKNLNLFNFLNYSKLE